VKAGLLDFILMPIYVISLWAIIRNFAFNKIKKGYYYYRYLPTFFILKAFFGTVYCLIYTYYYTYGGDSVSYFTSAAILVRGLFTFGPYAFFEILKAIISKDNYIPYLNEDTGYFNLFSLHDTHAIFTSIYTIPFALLGFNNYILATIVLNVISVWCNWKLFKVLVYYYPHLYKRSAMVLFFIPSILFWGSGILKDNYCMSFLCVYVYSFFQLYILKIKKIKYYIGFFLSVLLILSLKPYIALALVPGSLIWSNYNRIRNIKSTAGKFIFLPLSFLIAGLILSYVYTHFSEYFGEYSYDKILKKAVVTQRDMIRADAYSSNYFNIGEFDESFSGILSKFFPAVNAALFRPYIWECRNILMIFSGIENFFILLISLYIIVQIRLSIFRLIAGNPFLLFSIVFALFFGFFVGLTNANFGALVRLRITATVFYALSLMMLYSDYENMKKKITSYIPQKK